MMVFFVHIVAATLSAETHMLWPTIVTSSIALLGLVQLVERRGKEKNQLTSQRQIEIGTLIESMPEALFIFDNRGRIIETNSAAERVLQEPRGRIKELGTEQFAEFMTEPGQKPVDGDRVVNRALCGETVGEERRTLHLNQQPRLLEAVVSANPISSSSGEVVGALVSMRDVSELTALQRKMSDAERHTAIGKMTAGLAHDFNNVLDTISQAVAVMEIEPDRPKEERQLITRMIRNAVKRGAEIIGGVRRYLIGDGQETELVDVNEVLEEALELTRPLWQAVRSISVIRRFQPTKKVKANPSELRRVFTNLVINAIEAMPDGGTLTVGCEQSGLTIKAFVADTGEGIPEDQKRYIFSPYFTTKREGTGLGLSSAETSVKAQSGSISFDSKEGEGTKFCLEFPVATAEFPEGKVA
jgi:PAS domain S-box-containing protein